MDIVQIYMEGKADLWLQSYKRDKRELECENLCNNLGMRFGDCGQEDVVEEFNKLKQISTILAYQERFEELRFVI